MKDFFLAITFLIPAQGGFAQANNDLAGEGLKGKVRKVTEVQYVERASKPFMRTIDKYNPEGYLVEEIHNDYMLKLNTRKNIRFEMGNDGNLTRRSEIGDSGKLIRATDYRYDSLNHLIETTDKRSFDDRKVIYKTENYYDLRGNKMSEKKYTDGALNYQTTYSYDSKGRILGSKSFDKNNRVTILNDYNYHEGSAQWFYCERQNAGMRTHIFRIIDTAGLVLEKTTYISDYSKQTTETYSSFDSYGNWLKLIVQGTDSYFVIRKIEYYK